MRCRLCSQTKARVAGTVPAFQSSICSTLLSGLSANPVGGDHSQERPVKYEHNTLPSIEFTHLGGLPSANTRHKGIREKNLCLGILWDARLIRQAMYALVGAFRRRICIQNHRCVRSLCQVEICALELIITPYSPTEITDSASPQSVSGTAGETKVVPLEGLEPPTRNLGRCRSIL